MGRDGEIASSVDAREWRLRDPGVSVGLLSVVYAGSRFLAGGYGATVLLSGDGDEWTRVDSPTLPSVTKLVWSGTQLMASSGDGGPWLSPDGRTWTPADVAVSRSTVSSFASNGRLLLAGGALASEDGVSWYSTRAGGRRVRGGQPDDRGGALLRLRVGRGQPLR